MLDLKYMSSEESAGENILKVKPLPWLSTCATEFKQKLDEGQQRYVGKSFTRIQWKSFMVHDSAQA